MTKESVHHFSKLVKETSDRWEVVIPDKFKVGHEAHSGQVTGNFLGYVQGGALPEWEVPNTLTKYRTLMETFRLSR